jgi:hypothetical protein
MALANGQQQTVTMVESHMSTTLTSVQKIKVVKDYTVDSIDDALTDVGGIIGGTRLASYNPSTITGTEKTTIGADKIHSVLYDQYIKSGSGVIHEGTVGNLVFCKGTIYHIPAASPNTDDFTDIVDLIHRKIADNYVDDHGTASQKVTATNYYTTKLTSF